MHRTEARQALVDAAALYSVGGSDASELTMAAAQALVAGMDSSALRELAGVHAGAPWGEISPVADRAFGELGLRFPEWQSRQGKHDALRAMARRYALGYLTERELTSWAHSAIGHDAPDDLAAFAELDDSLDLVESGVAHPDRVLADFRAAIDALLASDPRE